MPEKTPYPFNTAVDYSFVLRNPNASFGTTSAILTLTMLDASGSIIATDAIDVAPLRPGETVLGGTQSFPPQKPASVTFQLSVPPDSWVSAGRWEPDRFKPLQVEALSVHTSTRPPSPDMVGFPQGYSYFTGFVVNPNDIGFKDYRIDVVHRSSSGSLLAGTYADFPSSLPPRGRVEFRIDTPDRLPQGDRYEALARPWYSADDAMPVR